MGERGRAGDPELLWLEVPENNEVNQKQGGARRREAQERRWRQEGGGGKGRGEGGSDPLNAGGDSEEEGN